MKIKPILSMLMFCFIGFSQELYPPVNSQYLAENPFVLSPIFAGIEDNLKIRANGIKQWVGIKDAPKNQSLYADFRTTNHSGIGFSLYNDSNGNTSQMGAKFSFSHHITLDLETKQYLSFGLSFHINSFKINSSQFNINSEFQPFDPGIDNNRTASNNNFDVGLLYRNKGFYMSISGANVLPKTKSNNLTRLPDMVLNYQLYLGYVIKNSSNSKVEIEPSIYHLFFGVDNRSASDFNLKYRRHNGFGNYYWGGIGYRFLNGQPSVPLTVAPMGGFKKANFCFGYSYQVNLNQLAYYNSGTHMVTLGYDFH